jgi:hypothetical protein
MALGGFGAAVHVVVLAVSFLWPALQLWCRPSAKQLMLRNILMRQCISSGELSVPFVSCRFCFDCLLLQRPMGSEVLLPPAQLLDSQRVASCMLSYLAAHHEMVEPLLDLFNCLGVGPAALAVQCNSCHHISHPWGFLQRLLLMPRQLVGTV